MRSIETWYAKDKPHLALRLGRGQSKSSEAGASDGGSEAESASASASGDGEGEKGEPQGTPALVAAVEALETAEQDASSQLLLSQAGQFEKMKTQKQLVEEAVFQVSHPCNGQWGLCRVRGEICGGQRFVQVGGKGGVSHPCKPAHCPSSTVRRFIMPRYLPRLAMCWACFCAGIECAKRGTFGFCLPGDIRCAVYGPLIA